MKKEITLAFTGDVMLGRLMNQVMKNYGIDYVWGDLRNELKDANLTLINLECAITESNKKWDMWPKVFFFKMSPKHKSVLKKAGVDYACLANNHILDFKEKGLLESIKFLKELKIRYGGAGKNLNEAKKPVIFKLNNLKIGIIAFQDNHSDWEAGKNKPGTFYLEVSDKGLEKIKPLIEKNKKNVDIMIVSAHWGPNMVEYPSEKHIDFAHSLIDTGVDIFYGHSSHVFQGIERYKNGLILYDCGEFIDDYAVDEFLRNDLSFLFKVKIKNKIKELELIPIIIKNFQVNKAKGKEAKEINEMMKKRSRIFKTKFIEKNKGLILRF